MPCRRRRPPSWAKCFDIVDSDEGSALRRKLMNNIIMLRAFLERCDLETYGDPSPIVCVKMGHESLARLASRRLPHAGLLANLVEFPARAKGRARFRLQVMANHTSRDIIDNGAALGGSDPGGRRRKTTR